jgi:hypothetical protein
MIIKGFGLFSLKLQIRIALEIQHRELHSATIMSDEDSSEKCLSEQTRVLDTGCFINR